MDLTSLPLLSFIIWLPLVGALLMLISFSDRTIKLIALVATLLDLLLALGLLLYWQNGEGGMQFQEFVPWLSALNISYSLGVDGISLYLVLLTVFLGPLVVLFSWRNIQQNLRSFMILLLLQQTAMLGVFLSLDLILFFLFWELSIIPMYFLIGQWGSGRRVYAANKFLLYTLAGSAFLLIAILVIYWQTGSFNWLDWRQASIPAGLQFWAFLAFALAFAVKVPLFPLHTWLPDAHVNAPTAGSVILAGVLLKMGTYGFIRFNLPLFPDVLSTFAPWLAALAIIGILYGALVALVQKDVKSLVAYSSVAHLGFVMLGVAALTSQSLSGAVLQNVNHGLSTGALFLLVGMLYDRRHTRLLADFGGLWKSVPVFSALFVIVAMSSAGLPGLNGFIGEFTILLGTFRVSPIWAALGTVGIIFAAWYLLTAARSLLFGPLDKPENQSLTDLNRRELWVLIPIVIMFFVIGLFPNLFLDKINPSVDELMQNVGQPPAIVQVID
ncbi:MAG: NADH-quinone oxidoreductase subunit M [Caldilineales bacterium]|nr:NADH-quinone oxidoreductase subunit M [Caldilineales bacterium]